MTEQRLSSHHSFSVGDGISVVLPMFNEEKNVEVVIKQVDEVLSLISSQYEIVVVNDGSTDETATILSNLLNSMTHLKVVTHPKNQGYGAALRSGINAASQTWTILMDGDGQFPAAEIIPLVGAMAGVDCVLGVRRSRSDPAIRRILGHIGNRLACRILKTRVLDINCGLKLFKTADLQSIDLYSSGGIINTEIVAKLLSRNCRIRQMTVEHMPRIHGKQTGGRLLVILKISIEGLRLVLKMVGKRQSRSETMKERRTYLFYCGHICPDRLAIMGCQAIFLRHSIQE